MLTKQETTGKNAPAGGSRVREPRGTALPHGSVSCMAIGVVSGFSLASHSDSGSFLVVHALLSQDGRQQEDVGHMVSPFDFS